VRDFGKSAAESSGQTPPKNSSQFAVWSLKEVKIKLYYNTKYILLKFKDIVYLKLIKKSKKKYYL